MARARSRCPGSQAAAGDDCGNFQQSERVDEMTISARLDRITRNSGYLVGYNPMKRKRKNGWLEENPRPFALYMDFGKDGKHDYKFIASFKTAEALEINWRGRAGC